MGLVVARVEPVHAVHDLYKISVSEFGCLAGQLMPYYGVIQFARGESRYNFLEFVSVDAEVVKRAWLRKLAVGSS